MNTLLVLLIAAAVVVALLFCRRINAWVDKLTTAKPIPRPVTLWSFTGYPNPVAPLGVYVPSLGRAPETIAEAELAGWYASREAALASPPEVAVAPPFGGEPPAPGPRRLWEITGMAEGDKLLAGTWYRTLEAP